VPQTGTLRDFNHTLEKNVTEPKTSETMLAALKDAANSTMTKEEFADQRISFVMGMIGSNSTITRDQAKEILSQHDCR